MTAPVPNMSVHPVRLAFWLRVMGAIAACGGFGSKLYLWSVEKASDAEWGTT